MPTLRLVLEQPAWPDLGDKKVINYEDPISVSALPGGMTKGGTSVAFRFDLPDGTVVIAQTSLALLNMAVIGIKARYPDPPGVGMNAK